ADARQILRVAIDMALWHQGAAAAVARIGPYCDCGPDHGRKRSKQEQPVFETHHDLSRLSKQAPTPVAVVKYSTCRHLLPHVLLVGRLDGVFDTKISRVRIRS